MQELKNTNISTYYPGMDILRGIAILLVVFYHNFNIVPFSEFGFLGVDLFFVLSGFLITNILLHDKESNGAIGNFYIRRVLRIFPVYYLTLIFFIFILPLLYPVPYNIRYYKDNQCWFYFFFQNWLFVLKPLEHTFLLNHFWSLAIEEQFYLLWPPIVFFTTRINRLLYLTAGLFVLVFIIRLLLLYENTFSRYMLAFTFIRFDGLLVGCALAIITKKKILLTKKIFLFIFIPAAIINTTFFCAVYIFKKHLLYFPYCGFSTFALLFGLAVYMVQISTLRLKPTALAGVLQFFGKISYGLYMYHWPLFVLLFPSFQAILVQNLKLSPSTGHLCSALIITLAAILLSIISHRYFEYFFLSLKKRFS